MYKRKEKEVLVVNFATIKYSENVTKMMMDERNIPDY